MKKIVVIGSLNIDLVSQVRELPERGETIISKDFHVTPGGKGANQAVAAARLNADVKMVGKIGNDSHGSILMNNLENANVDTSSITVGKTTGSAFITVNESGDNHIVLVPGANNEFTKNDIDQVVPDIKDSDLIIMQLEIPLEIIEYTLQIANQHNKKVILNPAPAQNLSKEIYPYIHTLIPNETELKQLTKMPVTTDEEIILAAKYLKSRGVEQVIVTLGEKGSYLVNSKGVEYIEPYPVKALDTTAAGDAFIAAFCVGLNEGHTDLSAARFASKVAALTVTKVGAQSSLPLRDEVENNNEEKAVIN
ncbi:ribokinase [Oceanobacillus jeddahense]|uniref:ribokinase n=1 Tax=Oceanobacillus jeddahense TaxID=1462527 RepID=UPI000595CD7B|nr:ribokinase [Oceanobacillus jeddahense]